MRFALQDVKRQIRRRDGELTVTLHFLAPDELQSEITQLIAYYDQRCGQTRRGFAQDEVGIGDYRLAHCLSAVLSAWYSWKQPPWSEIVGGLSEEARTALAEGTVLSPVLLRLALFNFVNARHSGFLGMNIRAAALADFASLYHIDVPQLEYLLALDSEDEAVLTRDTAAPPAVAEVVALYNQWVFEAALFNASEVRFTIDCTAFLAMQRETEPALVTGIGAAIKRLCFLARKLGIYYDLAYSSIRPEARPTLLHLTLYGPEEMTGGAQQYGLRLARLCRWLLDYSSPARASGRRQSARLPLKAIQQAEATVHIFQQAYRFSMDAHLLSLLPASELDSEIGRSSARASDAAALYDSSIEQSFAEAFAALERGHGVAGWSLEREPEPLLLPMEAGEAFAPGIFIPDFALTRGTRRIYIEILGFWTPAYRERKLQKLQRLKGRADLILALPRESRQAFAGLAADFPLVEYVSQLSATDLLRVVQTHYDDFEVRLAGLDHISVQERIRSAHFLEEKTCYEILHCYRRSELVRAANAVLAADMAYTPGLGLYLLDWMEHLHRSFVEWIMARGQAEMSLAAVIEEWKSLWPELAGSDEGVIEALFGLWPEVQVRHSSIFDAVLVVEGLQQSEKRLTEEETMVSTSKKSIRARRAAARTLPENGQQNLWE